MELSKVIAKLGTVSTSYLLPMLSCAEGPGLSRGKVGHKSTFTIVAKDRNGETCVTGKYYGKIKDTLEIHPLINKLETILLTTDLITEARCKTSFY